MSVKQERRPNQWMSSAVEQVSAQLITDVRSSRISPIKNSAEALERLNAKLESIQKYDMYHPGMLPCFAEKQNYRQKGVIYSNQNENVSGFGFNCMQVVPDGRVFAGTESELLVIEKSEGVWKSRPVFDLICKSADYLHVLPGGELLVASTNTLYHRVEDGGSWNNGHKAPGLGTDQVTCMRALSNGNIITGHTDHSLKMHTFKNGKWSESSILEDCMKFKDLLFPCCVEQSVNGEVFSGNYNGGLYKSSAYAYRQDEWSNEAIFRHNKAIGNLVLLDRQHVACSSENLVYLSQVNARGNWDTRLIYRNRNLLSALQALPDGRILFGDTGGDIGILSGANAERWKSNVLTTGKSGINCLQAIPDGRIFVAYSDNSIGIIDGD